MDQKERKKQEEMKEIEIGLIGFTRTYLSSRRLGSGRAGHLFPTIKSAHTRKYALKASRTKNSNSSLDTCGGSLIVFTLAVDSSRVPFVIDLNER